MKEPLEQNPIDVAGLLETLRETPPRDSSKLEDGRAEFLAQVNSLPQPVTPGRFLRHKLHTTTGVFRLRTLTIAVVIFFAVLTSSVVTVSAAQAAVPGDQLYPVKIWYEDFRLALAFSDARKLEMHLEFAAERLAEANQLEGDGLFDIPDQIAEDFFRHIQDASLLLHIDDDQDYAAEIEGLLSEYDDLENSRGDWEEHEDIDEDDHSGSSSEEDLDSDDAAGKDDEERKEPEDKKETDEPAESSDDLEEDDDSAESDDDLQPDETDEPDDEPDELEETGEPDEPDDND